MAQRAQSQREFIPVAEPDIGALELAYVTDAVQSGWISSLGEYLPRFEREFAAVLGVPAAVAVNNGSSALQLALAVLGIGAEDEVLVPAHTFAAVPAAVLHVGATPVFVDIDPDYWCLCPELISQAITDRTRAIVAVHSYGHPADLRAICSTAAPRGIQVVEDCAEALGARCAGTMVGAIGALGAHSFYGNKILTTGEGGMVTTSSLELADQLRYLRDHAMDPGRRYYHSSVGYNFRLTNVQAAIGCAQLTRLEWFWSRRREITEQYKAELEKIPGVRVNPSEKWATPVNWLTTVALPPEVSGLRDSLMEGLAAVGVDSRPTFVALTDLPPYQGFRSFGHDGEGSTPASRHLANSGLNLPTSTRLTDEDVGYVCRAFTSTLSSLQGQ